MVNALDSGEIDGAVRGNLPAKETSQAFDARHRGAAIQRAVLFEPKAGIGVLFGPVGITEGQGANARVAFGAGAVKLLLERGLSTEDPLVAVLSYGRAEDASRGARTASSLRESERVAKRLRAQGVDAFSAGVQLEDVLADADVVVAPEGTAGNLVFRALHLVGGMPSFGGLLVGSPLAFVDTSRARASFEDPVRLAAFLGSPRSP